MNLVTRTIGEFSFIFGQKGDDQEEWNAYGHCHTNGCRKTIVVTIEKVRVSPPYAPFPYVNPTYFWSIFCPHCGNETRVYEKQIPEHIRSRVLKIDSA